MEEPSDCLWCGKPLDNTDWYYTFDIRGNEYCYRCGSSFEYLYDAAETLYRKNRFLNLIRAEIDT